MDKLTYTLDTIYSIASFSRLILIVACLLIAALLFLVWTLHNKVETCLGNQEVLHDEIKDLKKIIQKGELEHERNGKQCNEGNTSSR